MANCLVCYYLINAEESPFEEMWICGATGKRLVEFSELVAMAKAPCEHFEEDDEVQEEPKNPCAECHFSEGPSDASTLFRCTHGNLMTATLIAQIPGVDKETGCRCFVQRRKAETAVFTGKMRG